MGGTGKTPTVCYLTTLLKKNGFSPAIISRGYTGKANNKINVVSDKENILLDVHLAGDEPFMLARMLPGVPVLTGKKRCHTCEYATEQLGCNVLILDDGFQHLKVHRNFDIVLFDKTVGFGVDRVFPGGDLRESKKALIRANLFLITGFDETARDRKSEIEKYLREHYPSIPLYKQIKTENSFYLNGNTQLNINDIPKNIGAFCAIANPDRFKNDLIACGFNLRFFSTFKDHHTYSESDLRQLSRVCQTEKVDAILTTDKDMVKINTELFDTSCISVRLHSRTDSSFDKIILQHLTDCT